MYKTFVLNLKRRPDRKIKTSVMFENANINDYQFIEGIDGETLNLNLEIKNLFEGNDFGNRKGFIGCALSHYNIWLNLLRDESVDYYLIFEDDFFLIDSFKDKLDEVKILLQKNINSIDLLFLGYHSRTENIYNNLDQILHLKEYNSSEYVGGFFSYIITKNGAIKMLEYIKNNGIKHGIDYVIKINKEMRIFETTPHIVLSSWVKNINDPVDSDIQRNFDGFNFNEIFDYNNYLFIPKMDILNNDIKYYSNKNISELIEYSNSNDKCNGFNTLGFLKSKIVMNELNSSQWLKSDNAGIYIKVDKQIRVKMLCNWQSSEELCNEWNPMSKGDCKWNNITITHEDDCIDYYVIINKPLNEKEYYDQSKTVIFQMEPMCEGTNQNWGIKTWGDWKEPDPTKFLQVRSHKNYYNNCTWQLNTTYQQFMKNKIEKKYNSISTVCSSKYFDPGHIKRIDFLKFIEKKEESSFKIDIYGHDNTHNFKNYTGNLPSNKKDDGIMPYKYYFMAENNKEHNYISEKFWEPLISECLCFYWGAENLSEYIDPLAYIKLDLDDFEGSYLIIKNAIENDLYSERIDIIRKEKEKVLNYYNFFPTLERIITNDIWTKENIEKINKKIKIVIIKSSDNKQWSLIKTLKDFNFEVEIVEIFDITKLIIENIDNTSDKRLIYNNSDVKYSKKTKGSLLNEWSHLKLYERLIDDTKYESYLILEDDVSLVESLNKLFYHMIYLPENYDICHIGNYGVDIKTRFEYQYNSYYYGIKKYFFNDSSAYFVSKKGANKILNFTNNYILFDSGELLYKSHLHIEDFNFYGVKNPVIRTV